MSINVILFGSLGEKAGRSQLTLADCTDTDTLKERLTAEYPLLKESVYLIAVDKKISHNNQKLEHGSEVAFLPPFAGG